MKKIIVYTHSDCLMKDNGLNHPEKKERLQIILKSIQNINSFDIDIKNAPLAEVHNIYLIHLHVNVEREFFKLFKIGKKCIRNQGYQINHFLVTCNLLS